MMFLIEELFILSFVLQYAPCNWLGMVMVQLFLKHRVQFGSSANTTPLYTHVLFINLRPCTMVCVLFSMPIWLLIFPAWHNLHMQIHATEGWPFWSNSGPKHAGIFKHWKGNAGIKLQPPGMGTDTGRACWRLQATTFMKNLVNFKFATHFPCMAQSSHANTRHWRLTLLVKFRSKTCRHLQTLKGKCWD